MHLTTYASGFSTAGFFELFGLMVSSQVFSSFTSCARDFRFDADRSRFPLNIMTHLQHSQYASQLNTGSDYTHFLCLSTHVARSPVVGNFSSANSSLIFLSLSVSYETFGSGAALSSSLCFPRDFPEGMSLEKALEDEEVDDLVGLGVWRRRLQLLSMWELTFLNLTDL